MRVIRRKKVSPERKAVEILSATSSFNSDAAAKMWASLEERVQSTVSKDQLETLYHVDGLTLREVYDYVDFGVSPGFYFEGDEKLSEECRVWSSNVHLKRIMEEVVKDIYVAGAGNAFVELGYNKSGRDIPGIRILNPKTIDYIRDDNNNVELDSEGRPVGFVMKKGAFGSSMRWTRNKIEKDGKKVWSSNVQDGRDRIAHFKLFGLGESFLGMSPLECVYKQALIRLNLEENCGESGFRSGGIVANVGDPNLPEISEKTFSKLVNDLKNINTQSIFVFPYHVKLSPLPSADISGRESLIIYFANIQAAGMGIPLSRHLYPTGRTAARAQDAMNLEFEQRVLAMQERLADQMREKLFYRLLKARGRVKRLDEVPYVRFKTKTFYTLEKTLNLLSRLARRNMVRYDPGLEKYIRNQLDLPVHFIDDAIKDWKEKGKSTSPTENKPERDVDAAEIADRVIELLEERSSLF